MQIVLVIPQMIAATIVFILLLYTMLRLYPGVSYLANNTDEYFKWLYIMSVCLSIWAMVFILIDKPYYEYFLIPHFGDAVNNLIAYYLTIIFPSMLIALFYLWIKHLKIYTLVNALILILIPFIFLLPSAPHDAYPNILSLILCIVVILIINAILYWLLDDRMLKHVSFFGSLIVYFSFVGIIIANILTYVM